MSFIDLHVHFLPGVDDGPLTLAQTLAMLRVAHGAGTRSLVATPHLHAPHFEPLEPVWLRAIFKETVERLRALADEPQTSFLGEMTFHLGAEHYLSPGFFAGLESGDVLPIGQSRYLLVEFPIGLPAPSMASAARRIVAAGFIPFLAHVERYETLRSRPEGLATLIELGCIAQLNGRSLTGAHGRRQRRLCQSLLERDLAQVVASDGHDDASRSPDLSSAAELLRRKFSHEKVASWVEGNPADILSNRPLSQSWARS